MNKNDFILDLDTHNTFKYNYKKLYLLNLTLSFNEIVKSLNFTSYLHQNLIIIDKINLIIINKINKIIINKMNKINIIIFNNNQAL